MLRDVEVGYFRVLQALGELFPRFHLNSVSLADIKAPNFASRSLQYFQQIHDLLVAHAFVKVLHNSGGEPSQMVNQDYTRQLIQTISTYLNVQGFTVSVLFQCIQHCVNHNLWRDKITAVLFHLQNNHI